MEHTSRRQGLALALVLALLAVDVRGSTVTRQARQSTSSSSATDNTGQSPWSLGYWFGDTSVNEAFSVLFPAIGADPLVCHTSDSDMYRTGLCMRMADCPYYNGESFGTCGGGLGSCCVFNNGCGGTTDKLISQFVSRTFTTTSPGSGECKLTVNPRHNNICQYRVDFESFNIAQPDKSSDCVVDFFGVTGGSVVPKLCGDLTGQHIYINVEPASGPIIFTVDTSKTLNMKRDWNIKIEQIDCNSPYRAPSGCLQFYNETSGLVKSLNFKASDQTDFEDAGYPQRTNSVTRPDPSQSQQSVSNPTNPTSNSSDNIANPSSDSDDMKDKDTMQNPNIDSMQQAIDASSILLTRDEIARLKTRHQTPNSHLDNLSQNDRVARRTRTFDQGMRQIQNLNYAICINPKVDYCDLTWTPSKAHGPHAFTMSGDSSGDPPSFRSDFGVETCSSDYVTIPGGIFREDTGADIHAVRYCGSKFPEVRTQSQPYILHVLTDTDEAGDSGNKGFALNFRQNLC